MVQDIGNTFRVLRLVLVAQEGVQNCGVGGGPLVWDLFTNARSARLRQRRAPQGKSSGAGAKPEQPVCKQVHGAGGGGHRRSIFFIYGNGNESGRLRFDLPEQ